jgi:hypothetical protein
MTLNSSDSSWITGKHSQKWMLWWTVSWLESLQYVCLLYPKVIEIFCHKNNYLCSCDIRGSHGGVARIHSFLEATPSSETSESNHHPTRRNSPKNHKFYLKHYNPNGFHVPSFIVQCTIKDRLKVIGGGGGGGGCITLTVELCSAWDTFRT